MMAVITKKYLRISNANAGSFAIVTPDPTPLHRRSHLITNSTPQTCGIFSLKKIGTEPASD
jgi:hypothetical protein